MTETRKLRVFLCHSSQDKPIVRELYRRLNAEGWINPWLDEEKLLPGQDWDLEIEKAVEAADVVIVCVSSNSVTKEGYIQRELKFVLDIALEKPEGTIFIIPLRLDDVQPPRRLRGWQYADYFPEQKRAGAYQRLLLSLRIREDKFDINNIEPVLDHMKLSSEEQGVISKEFVVPKSISSKPILKPKKNNSDNVQLQEIISVSGWKTAFSVFWMILSWAVGYWFVYLDSFYIVFSVLIGSVVIGFVLWQNRFITNWLSILWITIGFITGPILGILLGWLNPVSDESFGYAAIGVLSGVVGGYVTSFILYQENSLTGRLSMLWITLAWGLGLGIAGGGWSIGWVLAGSIAGAIGGSVMMGNIWKQVKA